LDFVQEFGLILFVFTIGLQLGPSFFASLRDSGLRINAMAAGIVFLGALVTLGFAWVAGISSPAAGGLFSGATTNTPALGAVQQTVTIVNHLRNPSLDASLPALAYAVGYPVGVFGIIFSLVFMRWMFRIDAEREAAEFRAERLRGLDPLVRMNIVVENPNLDGLRLGYVPGRREMAVAVSRIMRLNSRHVEPANEDTILHTGDCILAVGTAKHLHAFCLIVGSESAIDLMRTQGRVGFRRVLVTRREAVGKSIANLGLETIYGVTITRVLRANVEVAAAPELKLQFGDSLHIVGDEQNITKAADVLGDSLIALNKTDFIPFFLGILFGVLAGLAPIHFPGLPVPVRLGLAGGPLLVAILLARLGKAGPLVWYMPSTANTAMREMGIILFLACVGLKAGEHFVPTLLGRDGLVWCAGALAITLVPLLAMGIFARLVLKMNFIVICGLFAGSMTDPPALTFANAITKSDSPSVAYATVYPLTMLLRIIVAQTLVLLLAG
jgi:putative transport protein